jgi:hypothetical protein
MRTSQPAVTRLETEGANPRVETLARALGACGHELVLDSRRAQSSIDETLVARMLRIPPGERIKSFERSYANMRRFVLQARSSLGAVA